MVPLLIKELQEAANRRRTYLLRCLYGIALFGIALFWIHGLFRARANPTDILGTGGTVIDTLNPLLIVSVLLLQPVLMCDTICSERRRGSLDLLLTAGLRPRQIVIQKYVAGILPMLSLLLMVLPLLGVAYALGGVDNRQILLGAGAIFYLNAFVAAAALYGSARAADFVHALMLTVAAAVIATLCTSVISPWAMAPIIAVAGFPSLPAVVFGIAFALAPITLLLHEAARALRRPPLLSPAGWLMRELRALEQTAMALLVRPVLRGRAGRLPGDAPVRWRETRSVSFRSYAFVLFLVLFGIALMPLVPALVFNAGIWSTASLLFAPLLLLTVITGASAFSGERGRQTLDVLLTTPMPTDDIVRQKLALITEFIRIFLILATIIWSLRIAVVHFRIAHTVPEPGETPLAVFVRFPLHLLALVLHGWLFAWIAAALGLHLRSRAAANAIAAALAGTWLFFSGYPGFRAPVVILVTAAAIALTIDLVLRYRLRTPRPAVAGAIAVIGVMVAIAVFAGSPATDRFPGPAAILLAAPDAIAASFTRPPGADTFAAAAANTVAVAILLGIVRGHTLAVADRLLGRVPASAADTNPTPHPNPPLAARPTP